MNIMATSDTDITADEFIRRYIAVWGEDEVDYLIESGYIPVQLSNGKWTWLYTTAVTANVG
jgi:hypothetical protein